MPWFCADEKWVGGFWHDAKGPGSFLRKDEDARTKEMRHL